MTMTWKNEDRTVNGLIEQLRHHVGGRVLEASDAEYDAERRAWHLLVDQQPVAIVQVADLADIQATVRVAAEYGVPVITQPGGHGASKATAGPGILLRTGDLTGIDIGAETVRVEAGVKWRDLNAALDGTGLSSLPGSSGDVSVIGYLLGGGYSWFGRKYGLAANQVRSFGLVDADGNFQHVAADTDPDLFWALRGGGGEFGVVTSVELELTPCDTIHGGRMLWHYEHARPVLRAFASVTSSAPDELTVWAWLLNVPDAPFVPAPMRGRWMVAIDVAFLGDMSGMDELIAPIRAAGTPFADALGELPLAEVGRISQEPEDPMPAVGRAGLLTAFGDQAIDALLDAVDAGLPLVGAIEVRHLGGAFAQSGKADGAGGPVSEPYFLLTGGAALAPELEQAVDTALLGLLDAVKPSLSDRVPVNFAIEEPIERLYPAETLSRLREIKKRVDPAALIRGNHPLDQQ
ncbi:FAD-binding oxidoreductase [Kribbella sp. NPDC058245]|uniref:FAD-binding oxidoreductase n=1 Tax=Kribbella sp. NPDC058245 TaxID=3346399 RepID=UPI0036EA8F82